MGSCGGGLQHQHAAGGLHCHLQRHPGHHPGHPAQGHALYHSLQVCLDIELYELDFNTENIPGQCWDGQPPTTQSGYFTIRLPNTLIF